MTERQAPYAPTMTVDVPVHFVTDEERAEREFWSNIRQALLSMVDAVERFEHISPRTAELRKLGKGESLQNRA